MLERTGAGGTSRADPVGAYRTSRPDRPRGFHPGRAMIPSPKGRPLTCALYEQRRVSHPALAPPEGHRFMLGPTSPMAQVPSRSVSHRPRVDSGPFGPRWSARRAFSFVAARWCRRASYLPSASIVPTCPARTAARAGSLYRWGARTVHRAVRSPGAACIPPRWPPPAVGHPQRLRLLTQRRRRVHR